MNTGPVLNKFILKTSSPIFAALANVILSFVFFKIIDFARSRSFGFVLSIHSVIGGVFNGIGLVFVFLALQYVHPAIFAFVGRLGIVFAMILSTLFLNQKPDKAEIALGTVAILGALGSALTAGFDSSLIGFFLALGSTLCFSVSNLSFKFASKKYSSSQILSSSYMTSAILLFSFCIISSEPLRYATDGRSWSFIVAGALFGSCLGFWCYLESLKFLTFSRATLLRASGPLFTAAMAYPFFGLKFNIEQIASASILLLSIVLLSLYEGQKKIRAVQRI